MPNPLGTPHAFCGCMPTRVPVRRDPDALERPAEPHPLWALAVGLVYLFRTRPGLRMMRELEQAVRRYAADPSALWRLVRDAETVIDAPARPPRELP
jgi:hypothetical protein